MTPSAEAHAPGSRSDGPRQDGWRESAHRAQSSALHEGSTVVTCGAPLGSGGLGRHLQELLDALERAGSQARCICASTRAAAPAERRAMRHPLGVPYLTSLLRAVPELPTSVGFRVRASMVEFDAYAASRLPAAEHLIAFNSQALSQLRAARRAGYSSVSLVSANSHLRRVARQHALARRRYPLEGSWTSRLLARNLAEYAAADRIYYASSYIRDSFLEEGVPEELLSLFPLTPEPRYQADPGAVEPSSLFEIVYVGSLSVHKGVPLLIDAVRRLSHLDLRLRLVGGWGTPGMRRFVGEACAADQRIVVSPGDPLPHLRGASLCAHPAYEDGFGYAPAEALAAGVPVIVTQDTGMRELVRDGVDGRVLPTDDLDALAQAIEAAHRGELLERPTAPAGDG